MNTSTKVANERRSEKRADRTLNLAFLYLKNNDHVQAEKHVREYLSSESSDRGFRLLGDVLRAQNKRDEALAAYEKSLQLNPQQEDVLSAICDLIPSDPANSSRLEVWAARAAKSGFLDVADKFRRSLEVIKTQSFTSSVVDNSPALRPRQLASPVQQVNRVPESSPMRHAPIQQDGIMKMLEAHQRRVIESNNQIAKAIGENRLMIQKTTKALDLALKEIRELKSAVKQVEERQRETAENQHKLLTAFQTFQTLNDAYGDDEYENGEYEDYGEDYDQENVTHYPQPNQTQTPLNVKSLPNFDHLHISPGKEAAAKTAVNSKSDVEVVFVKQPEGELVQKAESLKLPSNFYSYMDKEECPGCRGCEKETSESAPPADASAGPSKSVLSPPKLVQTSQLDSLKICSPNQPAVNKPNPDPPVTSGAPFSFAVAAASANKTSTPLSQPSSTFQTPATAKNVFATPAQNNTAPGSFVFGCFGNSSGPSVFGAPANSTPASQSSASKPAVNAAPSLPNNDATTKTNTVPIFGSAFTADKQQDAGAKKDAAPTPPVFGFKVPDSLLVAATTNQSSSNSGFTWGGGSNNTASWMTSTATPIFGQKPAPKTNGKDKDDDNDGTDDEEGEGEEYDPHYAPIIEMPNLVEITTGEEDEEAVYSQRAKLYRYDKGTKAWKERGVGDLKILKHKEKQRYRIVLRREQVHKIACNHYLTKEMKLTPMNNSETAVCWYAMDYADGEPADEQFAVKFKNTEVLQQFKKKFEELQQTL